MNKSTRPPSSAGDFSLESHNMTSNHMTYIISGPSCSGKSTLLQSGEIYSIINLSSTYSVVFPDAIHDNIDSIEDGCFFHYNIMRVADQSYRNSDNCIQSLYNFESDPPWLEVSKLPAPKKAIILIASRTTLEKRMSSREHVEPKELTGCPPIQYPGSHWTGVLNTVDLYELYLAWCIELKKIGITYTLLSTESRDYDIIRQDQLKYICLNK